MSTPIEPRAVPTLTEVVEWAEPRALALSVDPLSPAAGPAASPIVPALGTEEQLTRRVLEGVQRQIDLMLDYRLREMLTPLLARAADGLIRDARNELASTLRDVVARAVAQEISRHRSR